MEVRKKCQKYLKMMKTVVYEKNGAMGLNIKKGLQWSCYNYVDVCMYVRHFGIKSPSNSDEFNEKSVTYTEKVIRLYDWWKGLKRVCHDWYSLIINGVHFSHEEWVEKYNYTCGIYNKTVPFECKNRSLVQKRECEMKEY